MVTRTISPDPASLQIEAIVPEAGAITIVLRTCRPSVACPDCDTPTKHVHSWYRRSFTDVLWQGLAVRFRLHTRRWRCPNPDCERRIFTERLPVVVAPFARRTVRLAEVVDAIAFALGGEAGARILATLGVPVSADTLLNRIRSTVGRAVRSTVFGVAVALCILIGVSGFLFAFASDALYVGPIIVLLLLARVLQRWSRWPAVALLALVAIGTVGTLLSIGAILADAYG